VKKGILITLEGNEGSGKSTQIKLLGAYLKKRGYSVFLTREPGGTKVSDGIRKILLDHRNHKITPLVETLLYMASRAQLVEEVIKPKLKQGKIVLCDRWLDATVAYQGYGGGVDVRWIRALGETATQGIRPRLSIFLDLPLEAGLRRAKSHKAADRMERKKLAYHKKVRRGYYAIAKAEPKRFRIVKVKESDPIQAAHDKIRKAVRHVLG